MAHPYPVETQAPAKKPFEDDFIMLSEFSEQEGPKPLLTIPREAGGSFDKNSFAVRIMAVDYQTGEPGAFRETKDTQVVLSEGYEPATKVYAFVYHLTLHDIQARGYVRPFCLAYLTMDERKILVHFEELLQEFSKVSEVLKHGNWPLFYQDLKKRVVDLEHAQDELATAKSSTPEGDKDSQVSNQLERCRADLDEAREILSVVEVLVEHGRNKELEAQVSRFEELYESYRPASDCLAGSRQRTDDMDATDPLSEKVLPNEASPPDPMGSSAAPGNDSSGLYQPHVLDVLKAKRFDQKLRSLVGLCGVCARLGLGHLKRILTHFGRDHEAVVVENEEFQSLEPHSALLTVGRRIVLNFLNGIDRCCTQCEWPPGCDSATWRVPAFYRSQSALTVSSWGESSFKSCAEELSGLEDAAGTPPIFRDNSMQFFDATDGSGLVPASAEHRPSQPDSLDDMHSLPQSDQSAEDLGLSEPALNHLPSPDKKGIVIGWLNKASGAADQDISQPPGPASQGLVSPSDASLTIDSTTEEVASSDFVLLDQPSASRGREYQSSVSPSHRQEQALPQPGTYSSVFSSASPTKRGPSFWDEPDRAEPETDPHPLGLVPRQEPGEVDDEGSLTPGVRSLSANFIQEDTIVPPSHSRHSSTVSRETLTLPLTSNRSPVVNVSTAAATISQQPLRVAQRPLTEKLLTPPSSVDMASKKKSALLLPLPSTQISSFSDDLCHSFVGKPGDGLLKFRDRYVFAVHLIYALLRGRPVVVLGKSESDVTAMIRTLSVFVPGHSSQHQVIEWFTKPLNVSHLSRVKLIGLHKGRRPMVPQSVKPYVSVLDFDTSTLVTPPYKGTFVSSLVHRQKKWMDDRSYLAHVHSVFLHIATKAFLYFHNFCLNVPLLRRERATKVPSAHAEPDRYAQSRASKNSFLTHLGVSDCDKHIIEYFVDVVKMQQMAQYRHSTHMDGDDYPASIRLDHSNCSVYQGRRPGGRFT